MDFPQRAILIFEEDSSLSSHSKPLMLESVLFCPILTWMADQLRADGVQRFFVVCGPRFAEEARACFPPEAEVTVSEQSSDLTAFLKTPDVTLVLPRAALPVAEAGAGFAYAATGYELAEAWREKMTNAVSGATLAGGWLPIFDLETLAEVEGLAKERVARRHRQNGVRIVDAATTYIDPRAVIGRGSVLLPGTIVQGECVIGQGCQIGPNAVVNHCCLGDEVIVNASQINDSTLDDGCDVGPYAHIRPNCAVGKGCHIGAFVQLKNCVLGDGTKMSHLTYIGDADVGRDVNFGCGTITTNYDGFHKYRCTVGDGAFIGCNTNLVAPVEVGAGAYIAAGATITKDVPPDALAVARTQQENKAGWAARRRQIQQGKKP